jgi:hypothetical protein
LVTPEVSGISGQIIFIEEAAEPSVHIEEGSEGLDEVELEFENPSLHCKSMRPPSGDLNLVLFQILPDLDEPAVPTTATKHQQTDAFFFVSFD